MRCSGCLDVQFLVCRIDCRPRVRSPLRPPSEVHVQRLAAAPPRQPHNTLQRCSSSSSSSISSTASQSARTPLAATVIDSPRSPSYSVFVDLVGFDDTQSGRWAGSPPAPRNDPSWLAFSFGFGRSPAHGLPFPADSSSWATALKRFQRDVQVFHDLGPPAPRARAVFALSSSVLSRRPYQIQVELVALGQFLVLERPPATLISASGLHVACRLWRSPGR